MVYCSVGEILQVVQESGPREWSTGVVHEGSPWTWGPRFVVSRKIYMTLVLLRNNGINFQLDKPKTNFLKKSIRYSGAKCWNNLPNEINKAKEMTMGQVKTFLRENDNIC